MAKITTKSFIQKYGATSDNWTGGRWSFINEQKKFIIFGVWDYHIENGRELIFSPDFEKNKETERRVPNYTALVKHIKLVDEENYQVYTFTKYRKSGEKLGIERFDDNLRKMSLIQKGLNRYAVRVDSASMEAKFRDYLANAGIKASTIDTYCSGLRLNQLSNYPKIQAELIITSVFEMTDAEHYEMFKPSLLKLYDQMKADKSKRGYESKTLNLDVALKHYKKFLEFDENLELEQALQPGSDDHFEGGSKKSYFKRYERNQIARRKCVEYHGYKCKVCGFDFEKIYGEIGKEFIHVHHINPMANAKKKRKINPKTDLIPVCPNCHAMLHRKMPPHDPLKVAALQKQMKKR